MGQAESQHLGFLLCALGADLEECTAAEPLGHPTIRLEKEQGQDRTWK